MWTIKNADLPGTEVEIGIISDKTGSPVYETSGIILNKEDQSGTFELKNIDESTKIKISTNDAGVVRFS